MNETEARRLRDENATLRSRVQDLELHLAALTSPKKDERAPAPAAPRTTSAAASEAPDALYESIKARLLRELPGEPVLLTIMASRPELVVEIKRQVVTVDEASGDGWIGRLIVEGFFDNTANGNSAFVELKKRGARVAKPTAYGWCDGMVKRGFLTKQQDGYRAVSGMKVNIVERA